MAFNGAGQIKTAGLQDCYWQERPFVINRRANDVAQEPGPVRFGPQKAPAFCQNLHGNAG
ncbi:MAG: hypothetical protein DMF08_10960 [Verrucomicrobia bacterium]|nr:MAG: hypothetical protein DMF08_10960 [Verrucomicrobiota bacterium]